MENRASLLQILDERRFMIAHPIQHKNQIILRINLCKELQQESFHLPLSLIAINIVINSVAGKIQSSKIEVNLDT